MESPDSPRHCILDGHMCSSTSFSEKEPMEKQSLPKCCVLDGPSCSSASTSEKEEKEEGFAEGSNTVANEIATRACTDTSTCSARYQCISEGPRSEESSSDGGRPDVATSIRQCKSPPRASHRRKSAPGSSNDRGQAAPLEFSPSKIDPDGVFDWPLCKRQMRYRVVQLFSRGELASETLISRERQEARALRIENAKLQIKAAQAAIDAENAQAENENIRKEARALSSQASASARKHLECKAIMESLAIENAVLREQLPRDCGRSVSELQRSSRNPISHSHPETVAGRLCQALVKPRLRLCLRSLRNSTRRYSSIGPSLAQHAQDHELWGSSDFVTVPWHFGLNI